jgi:hypothetical protein
VLSSLLREADFMFIEPKNVDRAIDLDPKSAPAMGPYTRLAPHELKASRKWSDDFWRRAWLSLAARLTEPLYNL